MLSFGTIKLVEAAAKAIQNMSAFSIKVEKKSVVAVAICASVIATR